MKIRKFAGTTENGVIEMVKEELGLDALVLNITKIQPKGIFSIFRKPTVEVTAAYVDKDDAVKDNKKPSDGNFLIAELNDSKIQIKDNINEFEKIMKEKKISDQTDRIAELENRLQETEGMLNKAVSQLSVAAHKLEGKENKYQNSLVNLFYKVLIEQGVLPEIAENLLDELDLVEEKEMLNLGIITKVLYNKIVNILGEAEPLEVSKKIGDEAQIAFFIGSTGVGKTTTIAKLSADLILNQNLDVGLITADTYRIAAVEQLKTYAEILRVDVQIVYNQDDLKQHIGKMKNNNDVILIDTAGRSHKNGLNLDELSELLDVAPNSERYLVASLATKYEDILSIVETYSEITDFKIIFTKMDETLRYGSILNICYNTGKKISYLTMGQNVPDDIETMRPEKIAKALLGLGEDN